MTPISSIATIDDLIVALHRLGYKKEYAEWKNGEILDKTPEKNSLTLLSALDQCNTSADETDLFELD